MLAVAQHPNLLQGENVVHGLACRLEDALGGGGAGAGDDVHGLMHVFLGVAEEDRGVADLKVRHTGGLLSAGWRWIL